LSPTKTFLYYHLPVILYAGAVIALSSIPNPKPLPLRVLAIDKLAHLAEYGIFSLLAFRSFSHLSIRINNNRAFLLSASFICVFALFDEYYQRFISGRRSDVYDFVADVIGAFAVLLLLWLRQRRINRKVPVVD
jgi:VanZ family protein